MFCTGQKSQERQGVPARWGDSARGSLTPKPPTVRESHEPGPPLEPGPLAPFPFPKKGGGGPGSKGGVGPLVVFLFRTCTGSRSARIPRAGSPQRVGTPRIFPKTSKVVKHILTLFDNFCAAPIFWPFLGDSERVILQQKKNWEYSGQEGICKDSPFLNSGHFPLENQQSSV